MLRYQKNCVYLAEVQQDVFYEPSVQVNIVDIEQIVQVSKPNNEAQQNNTSV